MAFAGLGWLTFLSTSVASHLEPYKLVPGFIGEGALTVWLLVMGVNEQRWHEQQRQSYANESRRLNQLSRAHLA